MPAPYATSMVVSARFSSTRSRISPRVAPPKPRQVTCTLVRPRVRRARGSMSAHLACIGLTIARRIGQRRRAARSLMLAVRKHTTSRCSHISPSGIDDEPWMLYRSVDVNESLSVKETTSVDTPGDPVDACLHRYGQMMRALLHVRATSGAWNEMNVTLPQIRVLSLLAGHAEGLSGRALAGLLGVGPSAVTPLVD